jgi:hypothetical protein
MNLPDESVRLTRLVEHLPESHRGPLQERSARLQGVYTEISRGVATNQVLMNEYLTTARGFFKAVAGSGETIPTYSRRGRTDDPKGAPVSFDGVA